MRDIGKIYSLIPKVMAEIGSIGKHQTNTFDKYRFRGIDDMYNAIQPALCKHGVFFVPEVVDCHSEQRKSSQDKPMMHTLLKMRFSFCAEDGSHVDVVTVGEAMDRGDKSANKAMSAALKYALLQLFCIPTEGDNDTENHSPEVGEAAAKQLEKALAEPAEATSDPKVLARQKFLAACQAISARDLNNWELSMKDAGNIWEQIGKMATPRPANLEAGAAWLKEQATLGLAEVGGEVQGVVVKVKA